MKDQTGQTVSADEKLQQRLLALAEEAGETLESFTEKLLTAYADDIERSQAERTEDEQRWQRFVESGSAVPFDQVRSKLRGLAAEASARSEPQ
jgi:predicted transcriptional regulator